MPVNLEGEISSALSSLQTNGYYVFRNRIQLDCLSKIQAVVAKGGLTPELPHQARASYEVNRHQAIGDCDRLRFFYSDKSIHSVSRILAPYMAAFRAIAQLYIGTTRLSSRQLGWLSVGRHLQNTTDLSDAAQLFHFDYDSFNFVKIFIYLSDVDAASGMHEYVSSSHKKFPMSQQALLNIPPYFRIQKEQLERIYGSSSVFVQHTGVAGTIIIEDTSGFHRGSPLHPGSIRDIMVLEYLDSDLRKLT